MILIDTSNFLLELEAPGSPVITEQNASGNPSIEYYAPLIKETAKNCTIVHICT